MFRYFRFYITPIYIAIVTVGMLFGEYWLWVPGLIFVIGVSVADQTFSQDYDEKPYRFPFFLDLALYLSLPSALGLFFGMFWAFGSGTQDVFGVGELIYSVTGRDVVDVRNNTAWYHYGLMFLFLTLLATAAGGLAGHELTHRTSRPFDLWLGRIAMALNWGIAFPIEHVYGHHTYVATTKDPATAARGDSLYQHLPKAMYRTIVNAWEIESARLEKTGNSFLSLKNVVLRMLLVSVLMTCFSYYCAGFTGVAAYLFVCLLTKIALEILNYVEHYGLVRDSNEPVQPRHSWNCNHVVSGIFTYNLTRHSHHHSDAQIHFQDLQTNSDQPEMPNGLLTAYLTTLVPPLWRKVITPKLLEWDKSQAVKEEYKIIREANINSGWEELKESVANRSDDFDFTEKTVAA